jgi:flagellar biosynthesis protein
LSQKRLKFNRPPVKASDRPLTAVALRYDPEGGGAPRVIASGQRKIAEQILAEARKHQIPIQDDPALTAALASVNLGEEIPPELYPVVAEILAYIYRVSRWRSEI